MIIYFFVCLVFKQKTAYDMRISDWSSDVCSSDLEPGDDQRVGEVDEERAHQRRDQERARRHAIAQHQRAHHRHGIGRSAEHERSEEHTSELQSLMRISYAVFCLKNKITIPTLHPHNITTYLDNT